MTADPTRLREALAEREWRKACPNSTKDGWLYAQRAAEKDPYSLTRYYDEADAILAALPEHRDDVLAVLGSDGRVLDEHDEAFYSEAFILADAVRRFLVRQQTRNVIDAGLLDEDVVRALTDSADRIWLIRTQRVQAARSPKEQP